MPEGMIDARLQVLVDRTEVVDVITRFHRAVDRKSWDLMRDEVLASDASWKWTAQNASGSFEDRVVGRDEIVAWLTSATTGTTVRHYTTSHLVEIEGDKASSESYMVVVDAITLKVLANGFVRADHIRLPEGWRIRMCHVDERIPDRVAEGVAPLLVARKAPPWTQGAPGLK